MGEITNSPIRCQENMEKIKDFNNVFINLHVPTRISSRFLDTRRTWRLPGMFANTS
jgi:hypothetical protein